MFNFIRNAFDAIRLTNELTEARRRIEQLEDAAKSRPVVDNFIAVKQEFSCADLNEDIRKAVIEDISPILSRDALSLLREIMSKGHAKDRGMYGEIAITGDNPAYGRVDFTFPSLHTRFDYVRLGRS